MSDGICCFGCAGLGGVMTESGPDVCPYCNGSGFYKQFVIGRRPKGEAKKLAKACVEKWSGVLSEICRETSRLSQ